jgi:hypothetical protein
MQDIPVGQVSSGENNTGVQSSMQLPFTQPSTAS